MTKTLSLALTLVLLAAGTPAADEKAPGKTPAPEHIKVQHILIGFEGSLPGKNITRSVEEAETLAKELLERARKGEDFDALVKEYSDDEHPGIYGMANLNIPPRQGEFPRNRMVAAFGDVGFTLAVGEIGLAVHHKQKSPYGFHIIKRTE